MSHTSPSLSPLPLSRRNDHHASSNDPANVPWALMLAQDLDPQGWSQSQGQHPSAAWLDPFYDISNVAPPDSTFDPSFARGVDILYHARYSGLPRDSSGRHDGHHHLSGTPAMNDDIWSTAGHVPISAPLTSTSLTQTDLNLVSYAQSSRPEYVDELTPSLLPTPIPPNDFNPSFDPSMSPMPNDWSKVYYDNGYTETRMPPQKAYMEDTSIHTSPQLNLPVLPLHQPDNRRPVIAVQNRQNTFQSEKPDKKPVRPSAKKPKSGVISSSAISKPSVEPSTDLISTKRATANFDDCITIFETVPGAIAQSKRRRKLDEASHKSFKVTRKIGACLECRFRKRTCNPGTPCQYCQKIFGQFNTAHLNCHRESPFVGFEVSDYFLLSSRRRIVDFKIKPATIDLTQPTSYITIDGSSGPCSLPLKIPVYQRLTSTLSLEEQAEIWRTKRNLSKSSSSELPEYVTMIAEDDEALGKRLVAWAIKYSSKFSRFFSSRYPTAYAYNVGTLYVSRQLPEHEVVNDLLRCVALSYILRAGVKCTPSSPFRTVEAKIDSVLYQLVRVGEAKLFAMMQKLVWVAAGRLKRQQMYPVAFVIWQCMRMMCLRSSHLANIVDRTTKSERLKQNTFEQDAERLRHCFLLLLSTHTALFRSDSPLILDFTDRMNQDLLGHDPDLIDEAMKLRSVILNFKENSLSKPLKASRWYRQISYNRLRDVLNGRGMSE